MTPKPAYIENGWSDDKKMKVELNIKDELFKSNTNDLGELYTLFWELSDFIKVCWKWNCLSVKVDYEWKPHGEDKLNIKFPDGLDVGDDVIRFIGDIHEGNRLKTALKFVLGLEDAGK